MLQIFKISIFNTMVLIEMIKFLKYDHPHLPTSLSSEEKCTVNNFSSIFVTKGLSRFSYVFFGTTNNNSERKTAENQ